MKTIHAQSDEFNFPHSQEVLGCLKSIGADALRYYQKEPELPEVLAKMHHLLKEMIFLENGTISVIHRVFENTIGKGAKVLIPGMSYPYYKKLASHLGAKVLRFRVERAGNEFRYDVGDILGKLGAKPKILVLVDPEEPCGCSIPEADLLRVLKAAGKNTLVLLDQTHEGFRGRRVKPVSRLVREFPNLLVTRSFSKFYGLAGARIAYCLCGKNAKKMIRYYEKYLGFNNVSQRLAMAALESQGHYEGTAREARRQKERLMKAIEGIPGCKGIRTDTIYSLVEVSPRLQKKLENEFVRNKIMVKWLRDYGADYLPMKNIVRITSTPQGETTRIINAFRRIQREKNAKK